jgi:subtilisin-like proprotein convertase family protein
MRSRQWIWILSCLLIAAGAWFFRPQGHHPSVNTQTKPSAAGQSAVTGPKALPFTILSTNNVQAAAAARARANQTRYRLSNTTKTLGELVNDRHAILLANALIDTSAKLNLSIPKPLQAPGDPGAYIVQANGPINNAFRAMLTASGAQIVSYIPNDAYLVTMAKSVADELAAGGLPVIPYEPYYKVSASLLPWVGKSLPADATLNVELFPGSEKTAIPAIEAAGGTVLSQAASQNGLILNVQPPADWTAIAGLPFAHIVEPSHQRVPANDLSRATVGVAADTQVISNYLNLSGSNVLVEVNDSGIDATHPDFSADHTGQLRVIGDSALSLVDTNGHGTHVAGIIAGDGTESMTVTNAQGSIMPATTNQFRGMAPAAMLYSVAALGNNGLKFVSDQYLQAAPALTNALISNNSWNYGGDSDYDLAAASYDAAVRDALPFVTGSQPVLFVFSAGNEGNGDDTSDPGSGSPDSIDSPGTAKNVITVGSIQEFRDITNEVTNADGTITAPWQPETSTSYRIAGFSSRGNVGIDTEGTFGRFKPDVVAPGTFIVSTRSQQWDINSYFYESQTNFNIQDFSVVVQADSLGAGEFPLVPTNTVQVTIQVVPNPRSPVPFPDLPIYFGLLSSPAYTGFAINQVSIPPDGGLTIPDILSSEAFYGFNFAVSNVTSAPINFDIVLDTITTNNPGNYYLVYSNLDQSLGTNNPSSTGPGPYYRYETGTSMSAADVSGVLALMQDFFTNTLQTAPSPALLKAMLINGARPTGAYDLQVQNNINFEGWGLVNLPDSVPPGLTNQLNEPCVEFIQDQSPTNALATGDSQTFLVTITETNPVAQTLPLRVTLAWTDPPGDPAAAIKLVNNLDLVVSNLDDPANPLIFYGNDIAEGSVFNTPHGGTNATANFDAINNVENVYISQPLGTNYSITVIGRGVNVNAVTAQTNNVVQDYALVISCGEGEVANAMTVTTGAGSFVSNPTGDQQITYIVTTNTPLLNQIVGANTPLLGTNTLPLGTNTMWSTNGQMTAGMTNQWHFYVVTNNALDNSGSSSDVTNAAFITFLPNTLAIPRMGVFADSTADATRPEADIDLYVTTDSNLLTLDPITLSNCLNGAQIGLSVGAPPVFNAASLGPGGTEFVVDTNSKPGQVYYVGVKSEDQMGAEYDFLSVFTSIPFSQMQNGNQLVNGLTLPINIPDGNPAHPGIAYIFALALYPMQVGQVIVNNSIVHQNFGDLIGTLNHNGIRDVLNNHDSLGSPPGPYNFVYDDFPSLTSRLSDGPGSLLDFVGTEAIGPWMLVEADTSPTQIGYVSNYNLTITPHQDLSHGVNVTIQPGSWFYDYVDVPVGYMELILSATNTSPVVGASPVQMYEKFGAPPTATVFDQEVLLTNCLTGIFPTGSLPGNSISTGPPLPLGFYYVGLFNPNATAQNVYIISDLIPVPVPAIFVTNGPSVAVPDDAVTNSSVFINSTQQIASMNISLIVTNARISDLAFTLVSPTGQRILLMENRGGTMADSLGHADVITNFFGTQTAGGAAASTNIIGPVGTSGTLLINYDLYIIPDTIDVYYGGNNIEHFAPPYTGSDISGTLTVNYGPGLGTNLVIVMNQGNNTNSTTAWEYTPTVVNLDYTYVTFTEDTNLTQIPIKFAIPPYDAGDDGTNYTLCDFELATNGDYFGFTNIYDAQGGWTLPTNLVTLSTVLTNASLLVTNVVVLTNNEVSVVTDPASAEAGSNYLALANGVITRTIPVTVGRQYSVSYAYRGPGIGGWWRGEGNANDSSDPENYGNNGSLIGRFDFPAGEVGQAFQMEAVGQPYGFAGTNTYVQIRQAPSLVLVNTTTNAETTNLAPVQTSPLDVGTGSGFTVEGWINPTNVLGAEPLVEWLARVPTNGADTNLVIEAGPFLDRDTGHYYYLLGSTNWTTSETWATQLGGHLVTLDTANEQNWVYDTFAQYGGVNRNLWIGLTNYTANPTNFAWSGGLTNVTYFNWAPGEPTNCSGNDFYTAILGPTNAYPGLWVLENNSGTNNNGVNCDVSPTNGIYGVVEVTNLQPNGVQLWISVTNSPGTTNLLVSSNGCLYANLVDITNGSHEIYSAPGLIQSNIYQHIALTYNTNTGVATLYYNGANVASTNLGVFVPKTTGDLLLGKDMSLLTNNFYTGKMDEISVYRRFLSDAEIAAIYNISAFSTNRNVGKFDPGITPPLSLAEAQVSLSTVGTNLVLGENTNWLMQGFTFTATTNSLQMQIAGLEPGLLLDSFGVAEASQGNLYYLPETSLDALNGDSAYGTWTLEIWDSRTGGVATNAQLVSWQLQFTMQTNVPITLNADNSSMNTVPPGATTYYAVNVPIWATLASNILVSATLPVNLLFNQTNPPTGSPVDYTFLANSTGGSYLMTTNPVPPPQLLPGQTYYLGVQNPNAQSATVVVEVDFDIIALTNGAPLSGVLTTNVTDVERYYAFDVTSNATEATFQLLKLSGNADLVVSQGLPLPTLTSSDYGSFNVSNADENIYVLTNSSPVPLSAGRWYLGVFRRDPGPVQYSILAKELDPQVGPPPVPNIIVLTNDVPFTFTAGPGAALTNFFKFTVTNTITSSVTNLVGAIHFELYYMNGDGDLTVATDAPPLAPPFFQSSQEPGLTPEVIYVHTNSTLTNLTADWYLGVPNHEITNISYTILAGIDTNLVFPAFPGVQGDQGAQGAGAGALGGRGGDVYHVVNLNDDGPGSLRYGIDTFVGTGATNTPGTGTTNITGSVSNLFGARTIVFDVSGTINLLSPLVITNSYLTIAGQSAQCGGITVAGQMTTVQSAHDVVIRDLRFRRGRADDSLQFTNVANVIADHVSAEWTSDNLISVLNSSNVTVQWSILADSLYITNNPPPTGSLLRYGGGALSFHHNLYADNYGGNPYLQDNLSLDFVNNVIYNWGISSGSSGTNDPVADPNGLTNQLNYVGNYLIAGPDTAFYSTNAAQTNYAFYGGITNTWIFQTNNFIDSDTNGILNGANTDWAMFTNYFTEFGRAFPLPPVAVDETFVAYEKVLDFAGVNLCKRDPVDTNIVTKVRTQTGTLISYPPLGGMVGWWKGEGNALDSIGGTTGIVYPGTTYAAGEVGQAFSFDGVNGCVMNTNSPPYTNIQNSFTMEFWANPQQGFNIMPEGGGLGNSGQSYAIFPDWGGLNSGGPAGTGVCVGTNGISVVEHCNNYMPSSLSYTNPINGWTHIAVVYSNKQPTLYVNGVKVRTGVTSPETFVYPSKNFGSSYDTELGFQFNLYGPYKGLLDEVSIYKRALSSDEIAAIYNAGKAGKFATAAPMPPYLDTDQDGIPDFWEITFGQNPTNASNNQLSTNPNYIGYTDLEEYLNWLAMPHALTVTNTPVGVDLYLLSGESGNLSFSVTNAVNGTVYLTNVLGSVTNTGSFSNSIAIFTPATNYSGYASFDYYVTNNDTVAYFGPVTVSVVVSAVPVVYAAINTNAPPMLSTNLPNLTIDELTTMTVTNTATDANTNLTLTYTVTMDIDTNAIIANGWPLTYVTTIPGPVIDTNGIITWTPSEAQGPGVYIITTVVSDNGIPPGTATNSFIVTVEEVNTAPVLPAQTNLTIGALTTLIVTNTATDSDIPPNPLTYQLIGPPGAVIDTNGIITWTPTLAQAPGLYTFTTIVTDTNQYALVNQSLSATNVFTVSVFVVGAPFVFTQPAQSVTGNSAQLNGMATPNGLPTTAWFEWGTNTSYGNQTPLVGVGAGFNVVYTTNLISGLVTNVPYHFRLVASNAVAVVYGFDQILDEANVVVWGADYVGQANVPPGLSNAVAIAGAYDHSLALKNNGTAVGWGDNTFGQATVPAGLNNLVAVAGGEYYSIALKNNGTVAAWGANILAQTNVPPGLNNVVEIAGGTYSSLALENNGAVVAWGASFFNLTNVPAGLNNVVAIAGGSYHSLAIVNDGTVVAWGDNSAGQTAVPVGLTNVVAIAGGSYHSLALQYNGTVVAWGDNSAGQTSVPAGLSNVVAVAAGGFHSLALKNDGTVVAWGDNTAGQTSVPVGLSNVVAIASGYFHSLALTPLFIVNSTNPIVLNITNGVPQTNSILPGGIIYYQVNVPTNADFATNSLLFALNGSLNVWFDTNTPPTTNVFLFGGTNGSYTLSTTNAPPLVPGSTYYLGVQNTNSVTVNYGIEVDFHLLTPTIPPIFISSITHTNIGGKFGFLLTWYAPTNDEFLVQLTGGLAPPLTWNNFSNIVTYTSLTPTNGIGFFEFFDDGTQFPFGLVRFYRLQLLQNLTSGVPLTNSVPANGIDYFMINVPVNADFATNLLLSATGPLNLLFNQTVLPTGTNAGDYTLLAGATNGSSVLSTTSVPTNIVPGGTYWLGVQNTNSFAVTFGIGVNFHLTAASNPISALSITFTNASGTNGFLLTWTAPTNDVFQVEWTGALLPANWQFFTNFIYYTGPSVPVNGLFSFFDNGSQTPPGLPLARFYRVVLAGSNPSTHTNAVPISSLTSTNIAGTNGFWLTWAAPTNYLFEMQWTTNLVPVVTWHTSPNIMAYSTFVSPTNSLFNFFDNGSQGGLGPIRFYRLIVLP